MAVPALASLGTSLAIAGVTSAAIVAAVPSTALPAVTSTNNVAGTSGVSLPSVPQYFFTVPFPNNQTVLYKLSQTDQTGTALPDFIFPLTPSNVAKQTVNLTNYYDVQSTSSTGVQRIVDLFGLTPNMITISGSTGFQFHSLDNYQWSGRESFANLVNYIQTFSLNLAQALKSTQNTKLPTMTFTDGFTQEAFNVVPFSSQGFSMDAARPLYQVYNIQLLATQSLITQAVNLAAQDAIIQAFVDTKAVLTAGVLSYVNAIENVLPGSNVIQ